MQLFLIKQGHCNYAQPVQPTPPLLWIVFLLLRALILAIRVQEAREDVDAVVDLVVLIFVDKLLHVFLEFGGGLLSFFDGSRERATKG